jgi:hypothetical protein
MVCVGEDQVAVQGLELLRRHALRVDLGGKCHAQVGWVQRRHCIARIRWCMHTRARHWHCTLSINCVGLPFKNPPTETADPNHHGKETGVAGLVHVPVLHHLYCSTGSDGHKHRGVACEVRQAQLAPPRPAGAAFRQHLELQCLGACRPFASHHRYQTTQQEQRDTERNRCGRVGIPSFLWRRRAESKYSRNPAFSIFAFKAGNFCFQIDLGRT